MDKIVWIIKVPLSYSGFIDSSDKVRSVYTVYANTKSEARGVLKKQLKLIRLPIGTEIVQMKP